MNAALKCDGNTPYRIDVEQFSDEWRQHVHIVLQKWVCGALLVRKFADGNDDIIGED